MKKTLKIIIFTILIIITFYSGFNYIYSLVDKTPSDTFIELVEHLYNDDIDIKIIDRNGKDVTNKVKTECSELYLQKDYQKIYNIFSDTYSFQFKESSLPKKSDVKNNN